MHKYFKSARKYVKEPNIDLKRLKMGPKSPFLGIFTTILGQISSISQCNSGRYQ